MSTSRLIHALNTPQSETKRTPLQIMGEPVISGLADMGINELFMCLLHCIGLQRAANNPYAQMFFLLFVVAPLFRTSIRATLKPNTIEQTPSATDGLKASFICNVLGYAAAAICIAACAKDDVHSDHGSMLHVHLMHSIVALCVALGFETIHNLGATRAVSNLFTHRHNGTTLERSQLLNGMQTTDIITSPSHSL